MLVCVCVCVCVLYVCVCVCVCVMGVWVIWMGMYQPINPPLQSYHASDSSSLRLSTLAEQHSLALARPKIWSQFCLVVTASSPHATDTPPHLHPLTYRFAYAYIHHDTHFPCCPQLSTHPPYQVWCDFVCRVCGVHCSLDTPRPARRGAAGFGGLGSGLGSGLGLGWGKG